MRKIFIYGLLISLFVSCTNNLPETNTAINVRASIVPGTGYLRCLVFIEGPDGNTVTGALVNVSNSLNQVTQLTYDIGRNAYTARIEVENDTFTFQIASILLNKPLEIKSATFADVENISSWALEAVGQVQAVGIMRGVDDNIFSPKGPYTREQSIVTMLRLYDIVK